MSKRKPVSGIEPRKEPKQERSRQTYQIILQGASKIIRRDGIEKLSTNKVAEESGVSIGSLYQYFPSKEAIIAALIDQIFELEYARVKEKLETISPALGAREVLKAILAHYFHIENEDLIFRKALIDLVSAVDKTAEALRFHRSMGELLIGYLHTHFKREPTAPDQETIVFMMTYMLKSAALSSVDENLKKVDKESLIEEGANIWLNLLRINPESNGSAV